LENFGYSYYGFGAQNGSHGMRELFASNSTTHVNKLLSKNTTNNISKFTIERNLKAFIINSKNDIIISGEDISELSPVDLFKLKDFFQNFKLKIKIIIYVRPLHNYIESQWVQKLTNSNDYTSLRFNSQFWIERLDLKTRITKFDYVFGEENVNVYSYNRQGFPNGSVTSHFFSTLEIPYHPSIVQEENVRLSLSASQIAFAYRKYRPKDKLSSDLRANELTFIKELQNIKGPKLHFHSDLINPYIKAYSLQREWIESRTLQPFENETHNDYPNVIRKESDLLCLTFEAREWLASRKIIAPHERTITPTKHKVINQHLTTYVSNLRTKSKLTRLKKFVTSLKKILE